MEELEAKAHAEFLAHHGKVLRVTGYIFGFEGEDSNDWKVNTEAFPLGIRVRVENTEKCDIENWNDDWLDPIWNVELLDLPDEMANGRNFWIHGTSFNTDGRIEKSAWEVSNE